MSRKTEGSPHPARALIPAGIGVVMAAGVLWTGGLPAAGTEDFWIKLCDALTVPGILLTGAGLLAELSGRGAMDGIGYPVRKAFGQILSEERRAAMPKTYYDYVKARESRVKHRSKATLWTGVGFLAGALGCLAVYFGKF